MLKVVTGVFGFAMSVSSAGDGSRAGSRSHESTDEVPAIAVDVAENPWPLVSLDAYVSPGSAVSVLIHPRRVRVYLDQEMFNRHSGLPGLKAMLVWSRWFLEHHCSFRSRRRELSRRRRRSLPLSWAPMD